MCRVKTCQVSINKRFYKYIIQQNITKYDDRGSYPCKYTHMHGRHPW